MLRLLHTSDWHLGHTLHGRDRRLEHAAFLTWLLATLVEVRADALLIAGDVFETANPPASAIQDLAEFLAEARRRLPKLDVVVIAGNHDSAPRLDALAPLLAFGGMRVIGALPRLADGSLDGDRLLVPLHDASGSIAAWLAAVPFLRVADLPFERDEVPREDDEPRPDPLIRGVEAIYAEVLAQAEAKRSPEQALIATGHLYMRGTALSELSERKILGGNQHALPRSIFADAWAYVGLGHLHLAQAVEQSEQVRYSGSPLPLSLSEADYEHQVLLCHFEGPELQLCQSLPIPRSVGMLRVPGEGPADLDAVLFQLETMPLEPFGEDERERWPWLEVRVRLREPVPDIRDRIERAVRARPVRLLRLTVEHAGLGGSFADFPTRRELDRIDPQQVFVDCFERRYGEQPDDELLSAFHELREALARGELEEAR
ncbi:exonuclease SbcCD subunit D C-terminal domain-containing protein [Nannocystaceae bacterium ST9]